MARFSFPDRSPLGPRVRWSDEQIRCVGIGDGWRTIVGVVADTKDFGLNEEPVHVLYQPFAQEPWAGGLVARTESDPALVTPAIVDIVRRYAVIYQDLLPFGDLSRPIPGAYLRHLDSPSLCVLGLPSAAFAPGLGVGQHLVLPDLPSSRLAG